MIKTHTLALSELQIVKGNKEKEFNIKIGDEVFLPNSRFWSSFGSKFLINRDMFRFFEPAEVLERVIEKNKDAVCKVTSSNNTLHAMVDEKTGILTEDQVNEIFKGRVQVVGSKFLHEVEFKEKVMINSEGFNYRSRFEVPIDGYGSSSAVSGLTRLACLNGMIASTKITETIIKLGGKDDLVHSLNRAYSTYSNEDGFDYVEKRTNASMTCNASLNEVEYASKAVNYCSQQIVNNFTMAVGNLKQRYGTTSFVSLSDRKKSLVPTDVSVFELINMLTEISTHLAKPEENIHLHRAIHHLLGKKEFDLEGISEFKNKEGFVDRYFSVA